LRERVGDFLLVKFTLAFTPNGRWQDNVGFANTGSVGFDDFEVNRSVWVGLWNLGERE
jgi:hypothetical protein